MLFLSPRISHLATRMKLPDPTPNGMLASLKHCVTEFDPMSGTASEKEVQKVSQYDQATSWTDWFRNLKPCFELENVRRG